MSVTQIKSERDSINGNVYMERVRHEIKTSETSGETNTVRLAKESFTARKIMGPQRARQRVRKKGWEMGRKIKAN